MTLAISALGPGVGSPDDEIYDILFDAQVPIREQSHVMQCQIEIMQVGQNDPELVNMFM